MSDRAELVTMSMPEWREAERRALARVGVSRAELAQMAQHDTFATTEQRKLWLLIGGETR